MKTAGKTLPGDEAINTLIAGVVAKFREQKPK
jgi:hypothetical protein